MSSSGARKAKSGLVVQAHVLLEISDRSELTSRGGGGWENAVQGLRQGTPSNGLYGEVPPERGTIFRLQVYERVVISLIEVHEREGKSVTAACERT